MKIFENRKTRGAISIFLVMILIPTMLLSAVLIDGSRLASARAMTQEAADLAALSVLSSYDQELKDEFGLFAMDDSGKAEAIYKESLNATLLAYGMSGTEEYSDRIWEILKSAVGAGNPYKGKSFLNLYDFSVDSCKVTPKYSLAEWQVLENQMVEYSKFRGIYVMADRFNILSSFGEAKKQAEEEREACEVMEEKMTVDEENQAVEKALKSLRDSIGSLNAAVQQTAADRNHYILCLEAKMKKIRRDYTEDDEAEDSDENELAAEYDSSRSQLRTDLQAVTACAADVLEKAELAKSEAEEAVKRLESFQSGHRDSANEAVSSMAEEAESSAEQYRSKYLPQIGSIVNDSVLKQIVNGGNLENSMAEKLAKIDEAIKRYGRELEEAEKKKAEEEKKSEGESEAEEEKEAESESETETEEEDKDETVYLYYYLTGGDSTEEIDQVLYGSSQSRCYKPAVNGVIRFFEGRSWPEINPLLEVNSEHGSEKIDEEFAGRQSGNDGSRSEDESEAERGSIDSAWYAVRPSAVFQSEEGNSSDLNFYNKDGNLASSKNIISQGKKASLVEQAGEAARDDVLCLSYMFGTFKTRLTGVNKFSGKGMSDSDKKSDYMPEWRYAHEEGELDMRFTPKKDRDTVLRGEIEYLIYGNATDRANEDAVYATIFAERLANNMIAVYQNKEIREACHSAASASAAASAVFLVPIPEPVFFWIFLTAWATAETVMDMNYLVHGGYKIPLFKTKDNLLLSDFPTGKGLISNYGNADKGIFVTYEDYLLILLLIKGQKKRLMRSADLIEVNRKKKDGSFSMAKAYTGIQADAGLSTRYLFGSVTPFAQEYEKGGAAGRLKFRSQIYLGY